MGLGEVSRQRKTPAVAGVLVLSQASWAFCSTERVDLEPGRQSPCAAKVLIGKRKLLTQQMPQQIFGVDWGAMGPDGSSS